MCLAIPGEVVELVEGSGDQLAVVDVAGVRRRVNVGLLGTEVSAGDWVLIHVGFALSKVDEQEAAESIALLNEMGQAYADEQRALAESGSG
jgi:hydrogenase expression/formation protein HypC